MLEIRQLFDTLNKKEQHIILQRLQLLRSIMGNERPIKLLGCFSKTIYKNTLHYYAEMQLGHIVCWHDTLGTFFVFKAADRTAFTLSSTFESHRHSILLFYYRTESNSRTDILFTIKTFPY